jgi:transposase
MTKGEIEMPKGDRKNYTKEFKLSAVYLMLSKTMQPKEVFQTLGVDRQTVYRWVSEFKAHGEAAFDKKAVLPGDEVRRLQRELADLRMENEILKKATAYFAEQHKNE